MNKIFEFILNKFGIFRIGDNYIKLIELVGIYPRSLEKWEILTRTHSYIKTNVKESMFLNMNITQRKDLITQEQLMKLDKAWTLRISKLLKSVNK